MSLERYRDIIPEWGRFQETIASRDPTTFRVRTGRIALEDLVERLRAQGFVLEPVQGLPDFIRVLDGPHSVADTIENWLGMFYIQQASTGVAAPLLGPRPGERILDMCAAPGGKATHAADLMQDSGCIVAVDRNEDRIRALLGNLYRTAHPNVLVWRGTGERFLTARCSTEFWSTHPVPRRVRYGAKAAVSACNRRSSGRGFQRGRKGSCVGPSL